jgi:hypothetical protein
MSGDKFRGVELNNGIRQCPTCSQLWAADLPLCPYCTIAREARHAYVEAQRQRRRCNGFPERSRSARSGQRKGRGQFWQRDRRAAEPITQAEGVSIMSGATTMSEVSPVQPALDALQDLRADIKKRVGKEGGNLNQLMLQRINTVEGVLLQIPSLQGMANVVNQQAQLMTFTMRNMSRLALKPADDINDGDDGTSDTKGE